MSFFDKLKDSLSKTRKSFGKIFDEFTTIKNFASEEFLEELYSILIQADLGVNFTQSLIDEVRKIKVRDNEELKNLIKEKLSQILFSQDTHLNITSGLNIILIVGVNGSGKTTTCAKLAYKFKKEGKKILMVASDTFRAGASEQLEIWGKRVDVDVIKSQIGADASAYVYDALSSARARNLDILLIDTAGRLHTKVNLMEELKKIKRVIEKQNKENLKETFLVIDALIGQNSLLQAKNFKEAMDISGIILTKLDGTAKGGIVIPIYEELKIPIKFIGTGEKIEDLIEFNPADFVNALLE